MDETSEKSDQKICEALPNTISSRESESGAMPSGSRDGQTKSVRGQACARASRSQVPETWGTCPECKMPVRLNSRGQNGHPAYFAHELRIPGPEGR